MIKHKFISVHSAQLEVTPMRGFGDDTVSLTTIEAQVWTPEDIKELRKFLKKLQKQLEGTQTA